MASKSKADAISLLKADHRKVEGLFARYEKSRSSDVKARLANDICMELSVHMTLEEDLFYPAVKATVAEDIYEEAFVEHDSAKTLMSELLRGSPADAFYDAKVTVLAEMIKHHVKEEEQRGGLFDQAKDDGDVDLLALGEKMAERKKLLVAQMASSGVTIPPIRSMTGAARARSAA